MKIRLTQARTGEWVVMAAGLLDGAMFTGEWAFGTEAGARAFAADPAAVDAAAREARQWAETRRRDE